MIYTLVMTLCLTTCNDTMPESYYSMDDCVEALKEIDKAMPSNDTIRFECKALEEE